jgi:O-methyltransferase involved in polyketide biosynthesis
MQQSRNYNTISPSARVLLLMKAHTTIPFAREAATLILAPEPFEQDFTTPRPGFWIRVMHFEARYWSINQLLPDDVSNILELSSGFSLRGLALATDRPVYYIDTDLPDLIATKQPLVDALAGPLRGHYELRPLNALDTTTFNNIMNEFPAGPITIVNEGLLVYLGIEEKRQLCRQIRSALSERGGYWITADIYLNRDLPEDPELSKGDSFREFLEQHNVKANMFSSFEEAESFFASEGLVIDKEFEPDYMSLTSLPHFLASASPELLQRIRTNFQGKMHTTWRLTTS